MTPMHLKRIRELERGSCFRATFGGKGAGK